MKKNLTLAAALLFTYLPLCAAQAQEPTADSSIGADAAPIAERPSTTRNVILIVGDGMDDHQITIARNYLAGANGRLLLDKMPVRSTSQILTVSEEDPSKPVYVADSANSATAMATGQTTSRGRIATSAKHDADFMTIAELAKTQGFQVGIVATSSITDATPASFVAHVSKRACENPSMMKDGLISGRVEIDCIEDMKENGGKGSIAEQIAASDYDLFLGGGSEHFEPMIEGGSVSVRKSAEENGFTLVTDADQLDTLAAGKVLGLFSPETMPRRWRGEDDRSAEAAVPSLLNRIHRYFGSVTLPDPMTCEDNPSFAGMPSLRDMTTAAIRHLSQTNASKSSPGFFLVIESASIDKQSHQRNPCGQIGEIEQLLESLEVSLAFAEGNPETLVLVTADHGQAAQITPIDSLFSVYGVPVYTPGQLAILETPEGSRMAINYATNNFALEEHTGVNVPLYANEAGKDLVPPMVSQPEIFTIMAKHLGLE